MKARDLVTIAILLTSCLFIIDASAGKPTKDQYNGEGNYKISTAAGTTAADCTKQGGKVETDANGAKWCTIASSKKTICLVYKPGHEGDDRYCSQSVPAPN